jgi:hypothetical protein
MKKLHYLNITVIIILSLLFSNNTKAQSLIEQSNRIYTSFKITSSGIKLPVQSQALVKRAYTKYRYNYSLDSGAAYGFAVEIWKLEFSTKSGISEIEGPKIGRKKEYYQFSLYNYWGKPLLKQQLDLADVEQVNNGESLITYSINLKNVPLILLDDTNEIRIEKVIAK